MNIPFGVDILELAKARDFYNRHKSRLSDIFSEEEKCFIEKGTLPYKRCAMILSGKEAVYKAIGASRSKISSFEKVRLRFDKKKELFYQPKPNQKLKLEFITTKNFVIASCL